MCVNERAMREPDREAVDAACQSMTASWVIEEARKNPGSIDALSVMINERGLEQSTRSLGRLSSEVTRIKASDSRRLQQEYQNLVNGLINQGLLDQPANDIGLASVLI